MMDPETAAQAKRLFFVCRTKLTEKLAESARAFSTGDYALARSILGRCYPMYKTMCEVNQRFREDAEGGTLFPNYMGPVKEGDDGWTS